MAILSEITEEECITERYKPPVRRRHFDLCNVARPSQLAESLITLRLTEHQSLCHVVVVVVPMSSYI